MWDFWLVQEESLWHLFHLQAPRSLPPVERHWHATVGHAVSSDLVEWTPRATAVVPGAAGEWDDLAIWTGSVIRHHSGRWLMAYTGMTRRGGHHVERIGLAWSDDLDSWEKDPSNPVLASDPRWYERPGTTTWQHGWRDPFLTRTHGDGYAMLLSARVADAEDPYRAGAVGLATSPDGLRWTARPPLPGTGGHFAQLEVPQLVEAGGRHHLIFSTNSDGPWPRNDPSGSPRIGTAELIGDRPFGPYTEPPSFIDADATGAHYAGRVVPVGSQRYVYLAFSDGGNDAFRGGVCDPVEVHLDHESGRFVLGHRLAPVPDGEHVADR